MIKTDIGMELGTVTYYSEDLSSLYRFAGKLGMPILAFPEDHHNTFSAPQWLFDGDEFGKIKVEASWRESLHHENANSIRFDRDTGRIYFERLSHPSWAETDDGGEFNSPNIRVSCPEEMLKYM